MSAPHAVGVAALLLEAQPALSPAALEAALKNTGIPLTDARNGRVTPRMDAWAAVQSVAPPLPTPTPAPRTISGIVTLQGRSSHNQIDITLSVAPCAGQGNAPATMPQTLTAQTNAQGRFTLLADPATPYRCLMARTPDYLEGQAVVGATTNTIAFTLLAGDVNADSRIDILDLASVAAHLGSDAAGADLNADGQVNIFDLTLMAANYGQQGPIVYNK